MMLLRPDVHDLAAREDTRTLVRATRHWSGGIRAETAAALGALRAVSAVPELIRLLEDREAEVREAAARALGDIGRTEAVDPLIAALRALKGPRNDRPGSKEYEFEAIAEALGRLNKPQGVAAVIESGTVRFHEGCSSISRPHIGGLCLSGGSEARAALVGIVTEHYLYETYSLVGVVEASDYLREPRVTAALIDVLNTCVELLKTPWPQSNNPPDMRNRNVEALALSAARALGRLGVKRAEPVLIDLLLYLPMHSVPSDCADSKKISAQAAQALADTKHAILTIRGEKSPVEYDCERGFLRLHDYQARRYRTDIEFGGTKRWTAEASATDGLG